MSLSDGLISANSLAAVGAPRGNPTSRMTGTASLLRLRIQTWYEVVVMSFVGLGGQALLRPKVQFALLGSESRTNQAEFLNIQSTHVGPCACHKNAS